MERDTEHIILEQFLPHLRPRTAWQAMRHAAFSVSEEDARVREITDHIAAASTSDKIRLPNACPPAMELVALALRAISAAADSLDLVHYGRDRLCQALDKYWLTPDLIAWQPRMHSGRKPRSRERSADNKSVPAVASGEQAGFCPKQ